MAIPTNVWSAGMRRLYLVILVALVNSANNGYDGSMLGGVVAFKEFQTFFGVLPDGLEIGQMNSVYNIGGIFGGLFAGVATDFKGRRVGMTIGCLLVLVGCIIQGAATGVGMMYGGRFLVGLGVPITVTAAPVWVAELAPPDLRGYLVGFYNTFWFVGSTFATITTLAVVSYVGDARWRVPLLVQGAPSVIVLLTVWFLPESPRYLVSRGQDEAAIEILAKYHADGDKDAENVKSQYKEIVEAIAEEKRYMADTFMGNLRGYLNCFVGRPNLHRMLIIFMIPFFCGNTIISYYFVAIFNNLGFNDETAVLGLNTGLGALGWIGSLIGAFTLTERLGRRQMAMWAAGMLVVGYIVIGACNVVGIGKDSLDKVIVLNQPAAIVAVVFIFILQLTFAMTWTPLQALYPTEIWPFEFRAKAVGITQLFFNLSGYVTNNANAVGIKNLGSYYYFIIGAWCLLWMVLMYFAFPETRNRSLEELNLVFNSPNPVKTSLQPPTETAVEVSSEKLV